MITNERQQESLAKIGEWKKVKKVKWLTGLLLFWGGALFGILDLTTPLPTPVRGEFAFVWLVMLGLGAFWWTKSKKLPTEEVLELARLHRGRLLVVDVISEMGLDIEMARRTLDRMVVKGYAFAGYCEEKGCEIFDFPGIREDQSHSTNESPAIDMPPVHHDNPSLPRVNRPMAKE